MKKEAMFNLSTITEIYDKDGNLKDTVSTAGPNICNMVEIVHNDSSGKLLEIINFPMKSFTYNWCKWLYCALSRFNSAMVYTSGAPISGSFIPSFCAVGANFSDDTFGIVVGSDEGSFYPMDEDNYCIGTQLYNGVDSNELIYHETYVKPLYTSGDEYVLEISRVFTNENSSAVTIKEIGLYANISGNLCIIRDIKNENNEDISVTLAQNESVEIRYKIKITQYSGFTKNFLSGLRGYFNYFNYYNVSDSISSADTVVVDTTNTSQTTDALLTLECDAPIYEDDYGIVVGSGINSIDWDSTQLAARILNGDTIDTLKYFITEFTYNKNSDDNSLYECHIKRSFVNDYSEDITITEAGIYGVGESYNRIMTMGVVYPSGITLSEHESMRVNFIIQTGL
ncbi:MAG TPA: hypothetical protein PKN48_00665 [Bacteroidales bacterium]|nr:hypothetical protein [Bacteroidales bacterium]